MENKILDNRKLYENIPNPKKEVVVELLEELEELTGKDGELLYYQIKKEVEKEVKISSFPTVKLFRILEEEINARSKTWKFILVFFAYPLDSYQDLAKKLNVAPQTVYKNLASKAKKYHEIESLMKARLEEIPRGKHKHVVKSDTP